MTKQEQIEEIAKYVCNVCDFPCDDHKSCPLAEETAEAIYNAGYRKVVYDRDCLSDLLNEEVKQLGARLQQEKEIERLKAEFKQLETNAEILAMGVRDLNHELYELTEQVKQAKIDVLAEVQNAENKS